MDSMRSLNTSLPHSHARPPPPPEQLLQAFKTAALSVTNLYKTAVTDQSSTRQAGYQDALEDLLVFLDKQHLGLQDGEGWRIRQWVTERFERSGTYNIESDDDRGESEKRGRSSSPAMMNKISPDSSEDQDQAKSRSISPVRIGSAPPLGHREEIAEAPERPPIFRFAATQPIAPQDMQMQSLDSTMSNGPSEVDPTIEASETAPIRVEVVSRGSRTPHRHASSRHNTRSSNREFTFTAGTKRKLQFPDFFDISNVGNGKDGNGGGGKRGRFV